MKHALAVLVIAACHRMPEGSPILPGTYALAVHVEVKAKHWIRKEPDLPITMRVDGQDVGDCLIEHAASGDCRFEARLGEDSGIALEVNDREGGAVLVHSEGWRTGKHLVMTTMGAVKEATLVIEPALGWWDVNGWRVAGLGMGVAAALGVMGGFRRKLFVADAGPPRCTHCGKRIAEDALKCDYCGAAQ